MNVQAQLVQGLGCQVKEFGFSSELVETPVDAEDYRWVSDVGCYRCIVTELDDSCALPRLQTLRVSRGLFLAARGATLWGNTLGFATSREVGWKLRGRANTPHNFRRCHSLGAYNE